MRIIIVSNRLSITLERVEEAWQARPSSGGLATAVGQLLRERGGVWIGWPGVTEDNSTGLAGFLADYGRDAAYEVLPVTLTAGELHGFYHGFSNEVIWPLFHDLQSFCNFVPEYWASYRAVIEKFANVVVANVQDEDLIWVQDYHLMALAGRLRERGLPNPIGFFLHIPFPPPDIFLKLPWRLEVLESLLGYDVIGFQTPRDRDNFLDCVRKLLPRTHIRKRPGGYSINHAGRTATVGAFPIGIQYEAVPEYQELKADIERLVTQVNGEFTQPGWVPVHYLFRDLDRSELLAYYRAADVALITSLKDGMNLVAKEYCACQTECDGVLILSEFAGAAFQMGNGAVLVNPYDLNGVAEALLRAVRMPREQRRPAMRRLRRVVERQDVRWWADSFLNACLTAASSAGQATPGEVCLLERM